MPRRRFSERDVIETLAWQRIFVDCFRCGKPFCEFSIELQRVTWLREPEREHLHEVALGGRDEPSNCRYSCSPCHAKITNGTKATSAGSSKHRIAKVKRLSGQTKPRFKRPIAARPFPKQSKPWPKRTVQP